MTSDIELFELSDIYTKMAALTKQRAEHLVTLAKIRDLNSLQTCIRQIQRNKLDMCDTAFNPVIQPIRQPLTLNHLLSFDSSEGPLE